MHLDSCNNCVTRTLNYETSLLQSLLTGARTVLKIGNHINKVQSVITQLKLHNRVLSCI